MLESRMLLSASGAGISADAGGETAMATLVPGTDIPPVAPADLSSTQGTLPKHVELTWDAVVDASTYQVFRGTSPSTEVKIAAQLTSPSYADLSAVPGVLYYYSVRGVTATGVVGTSAGPVTGYKPLQAPTGLGATDGTLPKHVEFTWDAVTGAASYQVFRGTSSTDETKIAVGLTSTSFADTSAVPGVDYFYSVRAVNSVGLGIEAGPAIGYRPVTITNVSVTAADMGQPVTFNLSVIDNTSAGAPAGNVTLSVDGSALANVTLTAQSGNTSTGSYTFPDDAGANAFFFGAHSATATYVPSGSLAGSNGASSFSLGLPQLTTLSDGTQYGTVEAGSGAGLTNGESGSAVFTGYIASTGQIFEDSQLDGSGLSFVEGEDLITGFSEGLEGAKAGESRVILIPAAEAYGANPPSANPGTGVQIPPNANLVFLVTLESISS